MDITEMSIEALKQRERGVERYFIIKDAGIGAKLKVGIVSDGYIITATQFDKKLSMVYAVDSWSELRTFLKSKLGVAIIAPFNAVLNNVNAGFEGLEAETRTVCVKNYSYADFEKVWNNPDYRVD